MSHDEDDLHYSMVIEWEPEGHVFVVTVPELPGCRTHGATYEDAVRHGQEVITLYLDAMRHWGRPVAPPRYFVFDPVATPVEESLAVG